MRRPVALALLSIALAVSTVGAQQQREPFPGFDAYVNAALKTWHLPGARTVQLVQPQPEMEEILSDVA